MVRAGGGALATLALAVVLLGSASGAPAMTVSGPVTKTWSAPYTGTAYSILIGTTTGCATLGLPVSPSFNLTTGAGRVALNSSARSCPGVNSSALWGIDDVFESPKFTATSGLHSFKASWSLNFTVHLAAHRGKTTQNASSTYSVEILFALVNLSSDGNVVGTETIGLYTHTIYTGTYSHTYSKVPQATVFNATLTKNTPYAFEAYVLTETETAATPGSSSASASVDLGTANHDAVLKSVTMS